MLDNVRRSPDRTLALARYRTLAERYDESCHRLGRIRVAALDLLALRPGDTVVDIACGTGVMLPVLANAVSPGGRVYGIEQSPDMAQIAVRRIREAKLDNVEILVSAVEDAVVGHRADALLLCYTHDVLQSDLAIERLRSLARPGARVVIAGTRILGWWATPLNVWKLWRSRLYLTTYQGLRVPWARIAINIPDLHVHRTYTFGTSYLAVGHLCGKAAPTVRSGASSGST